MDAAVPEDNQQADGADQAERKALGRIRLPDHLLEGVRAAPPLSPADAAMVRSILWGSS